MSVFLVVLISQVAIFSCLYVWFRVSDRQAREGNRLRRRLDEAVSVGGRIGRYVYGPNGPIFFIPLDEDPESRK